MFKKLNLKGALALQLLTCFVPAIGRAEMLTLAQAIEQAKGISPDIQGLAAQTASAEAKASQTLAPAEPTLGVNYQDMNTPYHGINEQASRVFSITQPMLFPGKSLTNHSALWEQAENIRSQMKAMMLTVSNNAKTVYFQLALSRENLNLNKETHDFFERIYAIAKRRYESGAITQVDLLNADAILHSNDNDLADMKSAEHQARAQLNILLGNPPNTDFEVEPLKMQKRQLGSYEDIEKSMFDHRNELKAAEHQLTSSEKAYRLAKMSLLPDFQFTVGTTFYDVTGASPLSTVNPGADHTYFAGVQMTIPLWFFFDQRQTIIGASKDRLAAESNLRSVLNQSKVALDTAYDSFRTNESKISNFEEHLLPVVDQSLSLAIINYGTGKVDFQTLSDTAAARRNTRQTYLTTIMNYLTAYSTIGQLIGEDFK